LETSLQRSRYELKYLVTESMAREIRDYARHYLAPDPHADPDRGYAYPIYSVYLDSPKLDLLHATVHGHADRFKLRMRYYDDRPESPVYFEIKRRYNNAILKARAVVRRQAWRRLLLPGAAPDRYDLVDPTDAQSDIALRRFCQLAQRLGARARVLVVYTREAWLTADGNSARMTFDRQLEGAPFDPLVDDTLTTRSDTWVKPPVQGVVLELKFTDRFPHWMREMTQLFGLQRCSFAKYVKCVHEMEPWRATGNGAEGERMVLEQVAREHSAAEQMILEANNPSEEIAGIDGLLPASVLERLPVPPPRLAVAAAAAVHSMPQVAAG
jgi:hypothetical protein